MGTWNPSRDREPDKKEEQAFKQFLISKYERKQWYKSPAEVKMEESAAAQQENKVEAKIQPPPSSKVSGRCGWRGALYLRRALLHGPSACRKLS